MSETTIFQSPADNQFYFWTPQHYKVGPYESEIACKKALEMYNSAHTTQERAIRLLGFTTWCPKHQAKHEYNEECWEDK